MAEYTKICTSEKHDIMIIIKVDWLDSMPELLIILIYDRLERKMTLFCYCFI